MMFERFDDDARTVAVRAVEHAIRLGHRHVGGEHILLAVVSAGHPASDVMRAQGVTPELVEEEIVRRAGQGAGGQDSGLFAGLDRDALATIGIDLDAVRARIEASFGPQALTSAAQAAHQGRHGHPGPRPARIVRAWRRKRRVRRAMAHAPGSRPPAAGRYRVPGPAPSGHVPFTPTSKKILELTRREAAALDDTHIGVEHIALALTTVESGLIPPILTAAGTQAPALRTAILDRYRRAS
jgi:ATP-dependent Clp protease ATP-binding subunit ClpA